MVCTALLVFVHRCTFGPQMHWHAGNALAQTVYTCLYMRSLSVIDHANISTEDMSKFDERRPLQLVSLVIRAGVMGMVKCCDLAYRELIKGNVHDVRNFMPLCHSLA